MNTNELKLSKAGGPSLRTGRWQTVLNNNLLILAILLIVVYAAVAEENFVSLSNLENIIRQFGALSMTALGMTFVIIGGLVDLSVVGVFSISAVSTALLAQRMDPIPAIALGILLGTVCGFVNSLILAYVGARTDADAVFLTFGLATFYMAMALIISNGTTIHIAKNSAVFNFIGKGTLFYVPAAFIIFLIFMVIAHLFLSRTKTGREIRLVGANRDAARLCGISSVKATIIIYTVMGFMAAIGAIILLSRVTTASATVGRSYDMNSILAVVLGGTRFRSGVGSVIRTMLGVLLVTVMANALNVIGINVNMQDIAKGAIFILAIWLDNRRKD